MPLGIELSRKVAAVWENRLADGQLESSVTEGIEMLATLASAPKLTERGKWV